MLRHHLNHFVTRMHWWWWWTWFSAFQKLFFKKTLMHLSCEIGWWIKLNYWITIPLESTTDLRSLLCKQHHTRFWQKIGFIDKNIFMVSVTNWCDFPPNQKLWTILEAIQKGMVKQIYCICSSIGQCICHEKA